MGSEVSRPSYVLSRCEVHRSLHGPPAVVAMPSILQPSPSASAVSCGTRGTHWPRGTLPAPLQLTCAAWLMLPRPPLPKAAEKEPGG